MAVGRVNQKHIFYVELRCSDVRDNYLVKVKASSKEVASSIAHEHTGEFIYRVMTPKEANQSGWRGFLRGTQKIN